MEEVGQGLAGPAAIDRLLAACRRGMSHRFFTDFIRPLLLAGLGSAIAGFLAYYTMRYTDMFSEVRQSLSSYLDGTVHRPAAFRVLVPALLRGLYAVTPPWMFDLFETIERTFPRHAFRFFVPPSNDLSTAKLPYYYYLFFINFASLLSTCFLVFRTYRFLFPRSGFAPLAFIPYMLLLAAVVAQRVAHIYDFLAMFLALMLFYCAIRQWTWRFLVIFPLACLTKETAFFSILFYAVYNFDFMSRRKLVVTVSLQAVIFAVIYGAVRYHYRHNVGVGAENYFIQNIRWALLPSFPGLTSILVLTFLTFFRWREKPVALRTTAVVMAVALAGFFLHSYHGEIRNLYELFPYAALLICRNIELIGADCLGIRPAHRDIRIVGGIERHNAAAASRP